MLWVCWRVPSRKPKLWNSCVDHLSSFWWKTQWCMLWECFHMTVPRGLFKIIFITRSFTSINTVQWMKNVIILQVFGSEALALCLWNLPPPYKRWSISQLQVHRQNELQVLVNFWTLIHLKHNWCSMSKSLHCSHAPSHCTLDLHTIDINTMDFT